MAIEGPNTNPEQSEQERKERRLDELFSIENKSPEEEAELTALVAEMVDAGIYKERKSDKKKDSAEDF